MKEYYKVLVDDIIVGFSQHGITIKPDDLYEANALRRASALYQTYVEWEVDRYMSCTGPSSNVEIRKAYHKLLRQREIPEHTPLLEIAADFERYYLHLLGVS